MTYSYKTLAIIGKQVVERHPDIANSILQTIATPTCTDLTKIPDYFKAYCLDIGVPPETVTGPVYKSSVTEIKKVFISAMLALYGQRHLFKKTITETLNQHPYSTTRMCSEVEFRRKKDVDFIQKVDEALHKIININ